MILIYIWDSFFVLKTGTNFSIENQLIFTSIIFLLKINTHFSFENQLILNCDFVLKIHEKFSIEKQLNFRITLYFLYRDFQRHFSMILLYFWNCHFIWKTNHFSIENQLVFASIIFLLKINTEFSIELPVHFQPALLYWKLIQFFLLKINSFFSASFFYWKSVLWKPVYKACRGYHTKSPPLGHFGSPKKRGGGLNVISGPSEIFP